MCHDQHEEHTSISVPAAVLLGVAVTSATTLGAIIAVQYVHPIQVHEGTTALLASLTALAGTGVIICAVAGQVLRRIDQLEEAVRARREVYVPRPVGHTYASQTVGIARPPVDADTAAAVQRINLKLMNGGGSN